MIKLWQWFNGKKTVIGTILFFIAAILSQVVIGIWGAEEAWIPKAVQTLEWFGMFFGGTGVAHKGIKKINESNPYR